MAVLATARNLCLLPFFTLALASSAHAQEVKIALTVLGFTADARQMLVQQDDDNHGGQLRLYDVATGQPTPRVQAIPLARGTALQSQKDARKLWRIVDPGVEDTILPLDSRDPEQTLSFFGLMAARDRFVLAVTDRQRLGKVADIAVQHDGADAWAKAALKALYWTTDRKWLVAIVTQKRKTPDVWTEVDEAHALAFRPSAIRWVQAPAKDQPRE